ncbi:hypothetical protein Rhal01_02957 [Rubritalea halochordaticola]|uniref:VWA domain-containing protein n=1 Tax=Rubritalea halochordaticola TaxID=714537 RepID=A0ABP9V5Y9_9BACT
MSFLAPAYLLGLLALIPLTAVYLLKVKPNRHQTNAWFLWDKVFEKKHSSSLFSRLRHFLSLLIMLLAVTALVLALAQPRFGNTDRSDLIIVIDRSASMSTVQDGSSRLDNALGKAHELVRGLSGDQRALIATVDSDLRFLTHLSRNTKDLHEALDSITQSTLPLSKQALLNTAEATATNNGEKANSRVLLFTDGCGPSPELGNVEIVSEFQKVDNLGIVSADIQPIPGSENMARCMIRLASSYAAEQEVEIELSYHSTGAIGKLSTLKIKPGLNAPVFFDVPDAQEGYWQLKLLHKDSLESDNLAHLYLQPVRTVPVATVAENSYFYERCIEAFALSGGALAPVADSGQASLTLAQGSISASAKGNFLLFAPKGESPYWSAPGDEIAVNLAISTENTHPVLRHLDVSQMHFVGAIRLKAPAEAQVLVKSEDGTPLIYIVNETNRNVVVVNLNPELGDFYMSPSFPVLVYDSATYMGGTEQVPSSSYSTGLSYTVSQTEPSQATLPSGNQHDIDAGRSLQLQEAGLYQLKTSKQDFQLAASLLATDESMQVNKLSEKVSEQASVPLSPSFWLIVIAILLILLESLLYHRRKVG